MTQWSAAPQPRDQAVLFTQRLDDALPPDHTVRMLWEILERLDWSLWEARYHGRLGQPPIHPRVLAAVLLYGLLTRIRSSRRLEEALQLRIDFRWLAEERRIDHSTLSEFRRKFAAELKQLFVQVGLVARELKLLSLEQLAFDGTRIRSNNRRSGTRTPQQLRELKAELARKFAEAEARGAQEDAQDQQLFGDGAAHRLPAELAELRQRQRCIDAALAELERVEQAGETTPSRLPITDPQSRVTPNKEGGFAPNYTPLATVDVSSGLIVAADVIAMTNEEHYLVAAVDEVQQQFDLAAPPPELLADGLLATGPNLEALEARQVTLYSPVPLPDSSKNPALRDDPSQAVPAAQWEQLPTTVVKPRSGEKRPQLDKSAFVYDPPRDCYWCPQGRQLTPRQTTTEQNRGGQTVVRVRYKADAATCAACPLRELCMQPGAKQRQITRDQHEAHRESLARRMATPEGQAKYAKRRHAGERPFAVIKHQFGARRFLLRGLDQVRTEWRWLATAFNLGRLISLIRTRAGPAAELVIPSPSPV
jgi:transposase